MRSLIRSVTVVLAVLMAGCTGEARPGSSPDPETSPGTAAADVASSDEDTGADLVLVDPSTGESIPVLVDGDQREPERSPQGERVVYQGSKGTGVPQIFLIDEQREHHRLTDLPGGPGSRPGPPTDRRSRSRERCARAATRTSS